MKTVEIKRPSDMNMYRVWWKISYPFRETDATQTYRDISRSSYNEFKRNHEESQS